MKEPSAPTVTEPASVTGPCQESGTVTSDSRTALPAWARDKTGTSIRLRLSSQGRLRDPRGRVTRGAWVFGRRWAAVAGAGLVDLGEAAGIDGGVPLPPAFRPGECVLNVAA